MESKVSKPKEHYVDNVKLYEELKIYIAEVDKVWPRDPKRKPTRNPKKKPSPEMMPQPSNYIGYCIMNIARGFAKKGSFSRYIFIEDMISDAIENCLTYLYNYDPEKYKNPFAYITQITYYAFLRRIFREKGILQFKNKYIERQNILGNTYADLDGSSLHTEMFGITINTPMSDWGMEEKPQEQIEEEIKPEKKEDIDE